MGARRLRRLVAVLLTVLVLLPAVPVSAERIASRGEDDASRPADVARVRAALEHAEVAKALGAQGLSAAEIEQRLERLSAEDVQRLAANLEQIQAAGSVPEYVWILLAVFLAVSTLAIIF
jgi:hypothetical protein